MKINGNPCTPEEYLSHKEKMTELKFLCRQHDWFYQFTDDSLAYKNGKEQADQIGRLAQSIGKDGERLYKAYIDIAFNPTADIEYRYSE
jgi:hypothetical protein